MSAISGFAFRLRPNVAALTIVLATVITSGCASLPQNLRQSLTVVIPHSVDFSELEYYAQRSRAAYASNTEIRSNFPDADRIVTVKGVDVLYFLETDRESRTQTVTIRGTANKPNVWEDFAISFVRDPILGIPLHRGFQGDGAAVFRDVKPHLIDRYSIRVTGHSLGGATAEILAFYLHREGFKVSRLVTFGSPKVTNGEGQTAAEAGIRATRVVYDKDIVPMLPPSSFLFGSLGGYQHVSPEVILRDGARYVYLPEHDANRLSTGEFWRNITDFSFSEHHMKLYLSNIETKAQDGAVQVPYFVRAPGYNTARVN